MWPERLQLSESSIKRMFSESKLSLERLDALCQDRWLGDIRPGAKDGRGTTAH